MDDKKPVYNRISKLQVRLCLARRARKVRQTDFTTAGTKRTKSPDPVSEEPVVLELQDSVPNSHDNEQVPDNIVFDEEPSDNEQIPEGRTKAKKAKLCETRRSCPQSTVNTDGWRMEEMCTLLLLTAKKSGIADIVLGKLLRIIALMVNISRHKDDDGLSFPSSVFRLKGQLKINPSTNQEIVYICPGTSVVKRKAGKTEKEQERCGVRLIPGRTPKMFVCEVCEREWDEKLLQKDGNHFATVPLHSIMTKMMCQFGRHTSSEPDAARKGPFVMNDVTDGSRYQKMGVSRKDLVILGHSDGAAISKSTNKKVYLTYVQCVNIPLEIGLPVWVLQQVWVEEDLPKDRECFLKEFSLQLQKTQFGNQGFMPVIWTDMERTALNGQLSHSAGQGCVYCVQVAESRNGRMCYRYDKAAGLKTHEMMSAMAEQYEAANPLQRAAVLKQRETNGFKRPSLIRHWEKFDLIEGFCIDVMHMFDEGVARYFLELLVEPGSVIYASTTSALQKLNLQRMNQRWLAIRVTGHNNRDV